MYGCLLLTLHWKYLITSQATVKSLNVWYSKFGSDEESSTLFVQKSPIQVCDKAVKDIALSAVVKYII